ncbi:hypothetical protein B0H67DRAFT_558450 [Lasiosphaeris hirsuta]|uniref:Uncharacterized protein n=1 Tax=Lasiosphaeris hirsuta TaxID=260670 RepID=A0AA39ZSL1_9PEZI|nr:hypothetical protein B0H67DRAFT_558450 [Lasiosphaeris hirsuta]
MKPLVLFSIVGTLPGADTRNLVTSYPFTSTFTSMTTFRIPPLDLFGLPVPTFAWVEHDVTTLEPHPSRPTVYPETIVQTAITKATSTVYSYTFFTDAPGSSTTLTTTSTRFDTYHVHTPAASHLRPGYSFTDFPGCGDCVLDKDWTPDGECETHEWGTGCSNQQCQWREHEGDAGNWYCYAGPHRGDREYMGRVCWRGDDIGFDPLAKPCLYGDQLPHCVPVTMTYKDPTRLDIRYQGNYPKPKAKTLAPESHDKFYWYNNMATTDEEARQIQLSEVEHRSDVANDGGRSRAGGHHLGTSPPNASGIVNATIKYGTDRWGPGDRAELTDQGSRQRDALESTPPMIQPKSLPLLESGLGFAVVVKRQPGVGIKPHPVPGDAGFPIVIDGEPALDVKPHADQPLITVVEREPSGSTSTRSPFRIKASQSPSGGSSNLTSLFDSCKRMNIEECIGTDPCNPMNVGTAKAGNDYVAKVSPITYDPVAASKPGRGLTQPASSSSIWED